MIPVFLFFFLLLSHTHADNLVPSLYGWGLDVSENVLFEKGPPGPSVRYNQNIPSACTSNVEGPVGYACPHMLMFSTDMILAAHYDNLSNDFHYAIAASHSDLDCGKCYQIQIVHTNSEEFLPQLVVQIVNSGNDVRPGQFDLFVGGGGLGLFNACSNDCRTKHCAGGPCAGVGMFDGSFEAWTPGGGCFLGGIRGVDGDNHTTWDMCTQLSASRGYKDQALFQSCYLSNVLGYHRNAEYTRSIHIQCPPGLQALTGLGRTDENTLPRASLTNDLPIVCKGESSITTFMDCCKPSCSWSGKGAPREDQPAVYVCNVFGMPI
jgi:hypothetical protein